MCRDLLSDREVRVLDAVRFYVEHAPRADSIKLGAAVTLFLAKKKERVGDVHYAALERSLRYLVDAIGEKVTVGPLIFTKAAEFLNAHPSARRRTSSHSLRRKRSRST